jgi:L-fuculose-phosphate aldolase
VKSVHEAREDVVTVARSLNPMGLNQGTSGNVSVRRRDSFLVTPSGVPYDSMKASEVVEVGFDGVPHGSALLPSSEWRIHRDLYVARPELGGIVHVHSMFASTLASHRKDIPAVHYIIAKAGGSTIRCAEYATFGTPELSAAVLKAMVGRKACLLANHGMVSAGDTVQAALALAVEVENLAALYWRALQLGPPVILDDAEMERVLEKFKSYGVQPRVRSLRAG